MRVQILSGTTPPPNPFWLHNGCRMKKQSECLIFKKEKKKKPKRMSKINQSDYISLRNVINIVSSTTRIIKATEI